MKYLNNIFCTIFLTILGYAVVIKLRSLPKWANTLNSLDLVNEYKILWLPYVILILEIVTVFALIFNNTRKIGQYFFCFLMGSYSFYTYYKIYISKDGECSCSGIFSQLSMTHHLTLNVLLLTFSILLLALNYVHFRRNLK